MKWEYKYFFLLTLDGIDELNELGERGWELVKLPNRYTIYGGEIRYKALFKRVIQ